MLGINSFSEHSAQLK